MSSKIPCVSWRYAGPLPKTPPGRLDGRRQARDPGADHADVGADLMHGFGGRPGDLGQVELGQGVRH
jgi:hypothetical protein